MTIYLVTMPDGKTSRWNEESIREAKRNHLAILADPKASPQVKKRARACLRALEEARPIEDDRTISRL